MWYLSRLTKHANPAIAPAIKNRLLSLVIPELINNDGFGETPEDGIPLKTIYQTDLQYVLMRCIQEQQVIINELKT
ncbi:MAG: hypothetical protein EBV10_09600, partial [Synechococcaceae bacterium WB6_1A_059]|nr:hypothetical protein [Synechococcaceae bacterium WB6_1A_059]